MRKAQSVNILLKLAGDRTEVLGVTLTILDWISSIASCNSPKSIARTGEAKSATAARAKAIDFMMRHWYRRKKMPLYQNAANYEL